MQNKELIRLKAKDPKSFYDLKNDRGDCLPVIEEYFGFLKTAIAENTTKGALRMFFNMVHNEGSFDYVFLT